MNASVYMKDVNIHCMYIYSTLEVQKFAKYPKMVPFMLIKVKNEDVVFIFVYNV